MYIVNCKGVVTVVKYERGKGANVDVNKEVVWMKYGQELIDSLERENERFRQSMRDRFQRVMDCEYDWDDCFISDKVEERGVSNNQKKIDLIKRGGCDWFIEYASLDGELVDARWCDTKYGWKLRAKMPDGSVVWTSANTRSGLAKKGLKKVECLRPAWFKFSSGGLKGMLGVYCGSYVLFPSDVNYATGEKASDEPIEIRDFSGGKRGCVE